jgi:hypothetical protein
MRATLVRTLSRLIAHMDFEEVLMAITFSSDIARLFRPKDIEAMKAAHANFDLSSYHDVCKWSTEILNGQLSAENNTDRGMIGLKHYASVGHTAAIDRQCSLRLSSRYSRSLLQVLPLRSLVILARKGDGLRLRHGGVRRPFDQRLELRRQRRQQQDGQ